MSVPTYSDEQDFLARKIRTAIADYGEGLTKSEVAEILEWEAVQVAQGSKENLSWIENLEEEEK